MSELIEFTQSEPKTTRITTTGKILVGITGGIALGLTVICASFVRPALRKFCLPYIPATNTQINNILTALKGKSGSLLDIGSGDGRIVLEMAKNNLRAEGIELNLWLVLYSKLNALKHGYHRKTRFYRGDLWKFNLNKYDNVVIFGVEQMMADLEKKFEKECKASCNIVACRFPLPNHSPIKTIGHGVDTVWVYNLHRENKEKS